MNPVESFDASALSFEEVTRLRKLGAKKPPKRHRTHMFIPTWLAMLRQVQMTRLDHGRRQIPKGEAKEAAAPTPEQIALRLESMAWNAAVDAKNAARKEARNGRR